MPVEAPQHVARCECQGTAQGEDEDHGKPLDVEHWEAVTDQIEERPVIGSWSARSGKRIVALTNDMQPIIRWVWELVVKGEFAWRKLQQARPCHNDCSPSISTVSRNEWFLAESMPHHVCQFVKQPICTVEVIEDQQAVLGEMRSGRGNGVLCQQEALQAQAGVTGSERERIGQREDDQVVMLGRILQEVAPIIHDLLHSWIAIRVVRVELLPELQDQRVDLHSSNRLDAVGQRRSGIGSAASAEDECVVKRTTREKLVDAPVEGLLVLPGDHRLMTSRVVHIDDISTRNGRVE